MKRFTKISSQIFVVISGLAFLSVGLMAFWSPQAVMDLVAVQLTNNDALSSIRGAYGGVGITLFISLLFLLKKHLSQALLFLCILWSLYALSRLITIYVNGSLGDFGIQWLVIESLFSVIALTLWVLNQSLNTLSQSKISISQ
ncbi:hypothetical protein AD998_08095 [bacterium 336/3]|nr:hypothetical protein AD998_08095 [bacterium 336/3]